MMTRSPLPALSARPSASPGWLRRLLPNEPEVAWSHLCCSPMRASPHAPRGQCQPVPLSEQDRSRWDRAKIDEGAALIAAARAHGSVGPHQLQAAIAVHDEAETMDDTDWPQASGLYDLLEFAAHPVHHAQPGRCGRTDINPVSMSVRLGTFIPGIRTGRWGRGIRRADSDIRRRQRED